MSSIKKSTLFKRIMLALLCGSMMTTATLADDQNKSSTSEQSTSTSSSTSTSDRTSVSGTSSDNTTSVSSPSYGQHSSSSLRNLTAQSFIQDAVLCSLKEIHMGQLATQKAQNSEVKQFAQRMVQDHSQANQQLMQIAQSKGYSLPSTNMFASLGLGSGSSSSQWSSTDRTSQGAGSRELDRITSSQPATGGTSSSSQTGSTSGQSSTDTTSTGGTTTPSTSGVDQGSSTSTSSQPSTTPDQTSGSQSSTSTSQSSNTSDTSSATSEQSSTSDTPSSSTSSQPAVGKSSDRSSLGSSSTLGSSTWQGQGSSGQLTAEDRQMFQHLQSLSGSEFDRAYIRHMVKGHAMDIQKYQQASQQLQDTEIKSFVSQTLPKLREHHTQAQQIARNLGISIQDTTGSSNWQRNQLNDREGQPRSGSEAGNLNR
jgi:predicted outer membrane protein